MVKKIEKREAKVTPIGKKEDQDATRDQVAPHDEPPVRVSVDDVRQKMNILRRVVGEVGFRVVQDNSFPALNGRVFMLHCIEDHIGEFDYEEKMRLLDAKNQGEESEPVEGD